MAGFVSASEFHSLHNCKRLVYLNKFGDRSKRLPYSAFDKMIMAKGIEFEDGLMARYDFVEPLYADADLRAGFEATLDLMRRGAAIIAQGVLIYEDIVGKPDVLIREEGESVFGGYYYRPVDVKSASHPKPSYELQVMNYAYMLARIQGRIPDGELWLKDREGEEFDHKVHPVVYDEEALLEVVNEIRAIHEQDLIPAPYHHSFCKGCVWRDVCLPALVAERDVSLLSGMRVGVLDELRSRGIMTIDDLATLTEDDIIDIKGVGAKTAFRLVKGAQAMARDEEIVLGYPDLPDAQVEIFFDVESVPTDGLIYLMGFIIRDGEDETFDYTLAESKGGEEAMWFGFLEKMEAVPGPIYHYGDYEVTVIRQLTEQYGGEERAKAVRERFINLEKVIKANVILPLKGYSLKDVAPWLGFAWESETKGGADSIAEYIEYLENGEWIHVQRVLDYNEDDCKATYVIKDWLASI